jgi:hypothetical protein
LTGRLSNRFSSNIGYREKSLLKFNQAAKKQTMKTVNRMHTRPQTLGTRLFYIFLVNTDATILFSLPLISSSSLPTGGEEKGEDVGDLEKDLNWALESAVNA